ncbi:MAG: toxin, partial [Myxococcaceae bacterium]|nr:toxin [Myxococcaceae bacterium]
MRRLALLLALGTACTVPTLAQLEEQQPRGCDGTHLCADGYTCLSGVCRPKTSGECINAQTQACGSDVGECDL